jgi:hypothetical protein
VIVQGQVLCGASNLPTVTLQTCNSGTDDASWLAAAGPEEQG